MPPLSRPSAVADWRTGSAPGELGPRLTRFTRPEVLRPTIPAHVAAGRPTSLNQALRAASREMVNIAWLWLRSETGARPLSEIKGSAQSDET